MTGSGRLDAFTLGDAALQVELWRDPAYTPGSPDHVHRYGREIVAGGRGQATGVEVRVDGVPAASAVLLCDAGCPGVSSSDAVLRDGTLYVAMRDHAAALSLPSLDVRWMTPVDDACMFGFVEAGDDALLLHGELWITRLGLDGRLVWQRGGADIFTGGCWMDGDAVVAVDWNGAEYRWRLADGEALAFTPGAHRATWDVDPAGR